MRPSVLAAVKSTWNGARAWLDAGPDGAGVVLFALVRGPTIVATTLEQLKENIDAPMTLSRTIAAIDAIHARITNPGA